MQIDVSAALFGVVQVIDHLKTLGTVEIIDARDFHELLLLRCIAQLCHYGDKRIARDDQCHLVGGLDQRQQIAAGQLGQLISQSVNRLHQRRGMHAHRSIVPTRRIFRCNCMMP